MNSQVLTAALRAHQEGRHAEAEAGYRRVLKADAQHSDALYLLGVLLHQRGRPAEARGFLQRAIATGTPRPDALNSLGDVHRVLGDFAAARDCFEQALRLRPGYAEAQQNLALTLHAEGRTNEALVLLFNAVGAQPTHAPLRLLLATLLQGVVLGSGNVLVREVLRLLLSDKDVSAQSIAGAVLGLVKSDPAFGKLLNAARLGGDLLETTPQEAQALMSDALVLVLLPQIVLRDADVEAVLVALRRAILARAQWQGDVATPTADVVLPFVAALAMQCFNAEYAFGRSEIEVRDIARLKGGLDAALAAGQDARTLESSLLLFALHAPLTALAGWAPLARVPLNEWSDAARLLMHAQVLDPLEEQQLAQSIPRGGLTGDSVSSAVRAMYEANPYPRWIVMQQPAVTSVQQFIRGLRPTKTAAVPPAILVAGCGTGQQPIHMARSFPEATVSAFDLSLASLAYGARMARQFGVADRIHFHQQDLLAFDADADYAIVACSGVLHHLADPLRGWRKLIAAVSPHGVMKIGLYSRLARRAVDAARAFVRAQQFPADDDGIRHARSAILALPEADPVRDVTTFTDFFSVSGCRDLLMHPHERSYTIPELAECLKVLRLQFLGFQLPHPVMARFATAHGAEASRDLQAWDHFEQAHPDTFSGMYQFWCCRAADTEHILHS